MRITYGKAEIGTSGRPHTRSNKPSERKKAETFHFERVSMRTTIFFYRSSPRRRSRNESNNGAYNSILSRTLRECRFTKGRVIRKYLATVERCFFIATINLAFEPSRCIIVDNDRVLEDDLSYNKGGTRSVIYCSPHFPRSLPTKSWIRSNALQRSPRQRGARAAFHSAIQFLLSILLFLFPPFFRRLLIAEQWIVGTRLFLDLLSRWSLRGESFIASVYRVYLRTLHSGSYSLTR